MKKKSFILIGLFMFFIGINCVKAGNCEPQALKQLSKIIYMEIGGTEASHKEDTFFMRLTTASVVLNNASTKSGNDWYEKIYNLKNNNYANYSTYKDKQFADVVPYYKKGEMLYIASLILKGNYNIPKNIKSHPAVSSKTVGIPIHKIAFLRFPFGNSGLMIPFS